MKFEVMNRWSGNVQFTADIDCAESAPMSIKLGLAVKWAVKTRADLTRADLTDAYLTGAKLTGADLTGAKLTGADLTDTDLTDADLAHADLTGADLTGAKLTGANLMGANLAHADLTGAKLTRAYLSHIKHDLWAILLANKHEVGGLLAALDAGKIDGSTYSGECACLVGTIARVKGCDHEGLQPDASRPAERWFLAIKPGHTPENHPIAKITKEWIEEFQKLAA